MSDDRPGAYLGDSVYMVIDPNGVELHINNGYGPKNQIYMEWQVYDALVQHVTAQVEKWQNGVKDE